ncbi:MAG: hypothetical protein M3R12_10635 [Actinomycetota bacterium]|nr:hypothetical protein [Actinomycetota bacterium]
MTRSGEPRLLALPELLRLPRRSPLYPELARTLAAADRVHLFRSDLDPVPVRPTSTTSQAGCYRMRQGDPVDLRVSRRHGRIALSFLHELGHLIDHQLGWVLGPGWASGGHEALEDWRAVASELPSQAPARAGRSRRRYLDSTKEVWARSYAQTIMVRSQDPWLHERLEGLLDLNDGSVWAAAEFAPVADEVERTLERLGLVRRTLSVAV